MSRTAFSIGFLCGAIFIYLWLTRKPDFTTTANIRVFDPYAEQKKTGTEN